MARLLNQERREGIEHWVSGHWLTRLLTSHVSLAFCYGVFLFLYEIALLREVVPAVHPILIGWAGALFVYDLLIRHIWKKMPYWKPLALFVIAAGVTALSTLEAGLSVGIKAVIMIAVPLCAFYPVCLLETKQNRERAMVKAMLGACVIIFLASLTAIGMYLARYSETLTFMGVEKLTGYRYYTPTDPTSGVLLYGIYEDTNHAAVYSLVFAVYSVFLYAACAKGLFAHKWMNRAGQIFAIANLAVQIVYFPLANSRGGWLCLCVAAVLAMFAYCFCGRLSEKHAWLRAVKAMGISAACVAVLCAALLGLRTGVSWISDARWEASVQATQPVDPTVSTDAPVDPTVSTDAPVDPTASTDAPVDPTVSTDIPVDPTESTDLPVTVPSEPAPPEQENHGDIFDKKDTADGSGRIWIWTDAWSLYVKRPVLGVGADYAFYAEKYGVAPYSMGYGKAVHNSYLDVLLEYGIVGFLIMMSFWALCLWNVLKRIGTQGRQLERRYYIAFFAVLLVAGVSFFLSCVFINTTAMYYIMLIMTGYLLAQDEQTAPRRDSVEKA